MATLGNTSTSSLLSSAATIQKQLASLQDTQHAQAWQYGEQDQAAYDTYKAYIAGRTAKLQSTGSITDAEKAQSFLGTSMSVDRTFRSNQVQNASQGILEGNYSSAQKAELLKGLAVDAYKSGDVQNGQAIQTMYDRQVLANQAQDEANQRAAAAGEVKAQAAMAKKYTAAATSIKDQMDQLQGQLNKSGSNGTFTLTNKDGSVVYEGKGLAGFATAKSMLYSASASLYNSGSQDPGLAPDVQARLSDAGTNLAKDSHFQDLMSPQVQSELSQGKAPFEITKDVNTGAHDIKLQGNVIGQSIGPDGQLTNTFQPAMDAPDKKTGKGNVDITEGGAFSQEHFFAEKNPKTGLPDPKLGYYFMQTDAQGNQHKVDYNPTTGEHVLADNSGVNSFANGGTNKASGITAQAHNDLGLGNAAAALQQGAEGLGVTADHIAGKVGQAAGALPGVISKIAHGGSVLDALMHPNHQLNPASSDSFMAGVSHFFSNPVTSLVNFAGTQRAQNQARFAELAANASRQMAAAQQAMAQAHAANAATAATPAAQMATHFQPANYAATPAAGLNTVTSQSVAKNPDGSVNPTAAATQLVTGLGYGNF